MVQPLYHRFAGDKGTRYEPLWRAHLGWLACSEYAIASAEGFGIELSDATRERWFRFGAFAYLLDQLIDEAALERRVMAEKIFASLVRDGEDEVNQAPEWVDENLLVVARLFSASIDELGRRSQLEPLALGFLECARQKAAAREVGSYARAIAREGQLMGRLIAQLMTTAELSHPQYRRFEKWFGRFCAGGALLDSARDMQRDFTEERSSVRPTRRNRGILLGWCFAYSLRLLSRPQALRRLVAIFRDFWGIGFRVTPEQAEPGIVVWKARAAEVKKTPV